METPNNGKETVTDPETIIHDPDIDAEFIVRPGREKHDRAEIAKSTTEPDAIKTVSMDAIFFCRISDLTCLMAWCVYLGSLPRPTLPSPLPP